MCVSLYMYTYIYKLHKTTLSATSVGYESSVFVVSPYNCIYCRQWISLVNWTNIHSLYCSPEHAPFSRNIKIKKTRCHYISGNRQWSNRHPVSENICHKTWCPENTAIQSCGSHNQRHPRHHNNYLGSAVSWQHGASSALDVKIKWSTTIVDGVAITYVYKPLGSHLNANFLPS